MPEPAALINPDHIFQQLLEAIPLTAAGARAAEVAADLDVDAFDKVPFITHSSTVAADRNADGLWSCSLTVTAFIEAGVANFPIIQRLYAGIHAWDWPDNGIVPGVGAVERVERDLQAFTRNGRGVPMLNKVVTPYVGSFELSLRSL